MREVFFVLLTKIAWATSKQFLLHVAKSSFQYYIRLFFSLFLPVYFLFFCVLIFRFCLVIFSFFGILFIAGFTI